MSKLIDLAGKKFGRLTVLYKGETVKHGKSSKWVCKCECGNIVEKTSSYLKNSKYPSCGCYKKEVTIAVRKSERKYNQYEILGDCVMMYASNTGTPFYIDKEDLDKVSKYTWMENHKGYIVRTAKYLALHRYVMDDLSSDMVIDHIDRDKKNNRKSNLRVVTQQNNTLNRSINTNNEFGVSGVHKNKSKINPYAVTLGAKGRFFSGSYKTLEEAIVARLKAEKEMFGDEAPQKHLFKEYGIK
jgi:hypothetical protein|nr:MAG TPA: homing endonuclease [Caudoviricetes sp.]